MDFYNHINQSKFDNLITKESTHDLNDQLYNKNLSIPINFNENDYIQRKNQGSPINYNEGSKILYQQSIPTMIQNQTSENCMIGNNSISMLNSTDGVPNHSYVLPHNTIHTKQNL